MFRLKELRKAEKMSQETLAQEMGVSRSTVAMWERGTDPGMEMLGRLAARFHVSVNYLIGVEEVIKKEPAAPGSEPSGKVSEFTVSDFEKNLIISYRKAPAVLQQAIVDMLHVTEPEKRRDKATA